MVTAVRTSDPTSSYDNLGALFRQMADMYDLQEVILSRQEVKAANGMFQRDGCGIYRPELTPWTRALLEEANSRLDS
jgi:hypothetical protein